MGKKRRQAWGITVACSRQFGRRLIKNPLKGCND